ncbi:zinc finger BED domain-containing protein RICESLEEPER 2-like [Rhizophagus irregularis DAOM 181602=DAOM 197198]|nr:zinc finger BED domain-containing protein RICESLEEPER 2-like [Rhizophagus irregularis DAOM 181602=DAOM 197198]
MASTSGSSYDVNTDIDGYDMEDDDRLPETEPDQEMNEADDDQEITIEKSKKKTSIAHLNFTLNKQNNTHSCIHCGMTYKVSKNGSTSTLIKHLKNKHNNIIAAEKKVGAMDKFVKKADELKFTQDNWRNDLIKWVVVSDQPFTVVDDDHFKVMIKRLNREAIIPSAVTIRKDIHQAFNDEQTSIQKELQNVPGQISFTLDAWTSKN